MADSGEIATAVESYLLVESSQAVIVRAVDGINEGIFIAHNLKNRRPVSAS